MTDKKFNYFCVLLLYSTAMSTCHMQLSPYSSLPQHILHFGTHIAGRANSKIRMSTSSINILIRHSHGYDLAASRTAPLAVQFQSATHFSMSTTLCNTCTMLCFCIIIGNRFFLLVISIPSYGPNLEKTLPNIFWGKPYLKLNV